MSDGPFLAEFAALYEEGGVAWRLRQSAETALLSPSGSHDPYEVGRLRGFLQGLDLLKVRLEAEHDHKRQEPAATASAHGRKPLRRVL